MKLNNIIKVWVLPCAEINGVVRVNSKEAKLNNVGSFELIEDAKYPCQLTISEKTDDKCREYTSKLVLNTCDGWYDEVPNAFLCETADGDKYLIGSKERPYPTVTVTETHPDNGKDSQLNEVTVQWVSPKKPPIIVD